MRQHAWLDKGETVIEQPNYIKKNKIYNPKCSEIFQNVHHNGKIVLRSGVVLFRIKNYFPREVIVAMIKKIIEKARQSGKKAIAEHDSKRALNTLGIPVVREIAVSDKNEVAEAAGKIGYPVALKGLGSEFMHKTESGLVRLNLPDERAVREAAETIIKNAGENLEGFLVQPTVRGKREFVAGLFHDGQFGPVVMFGLGGVFTEALSDVVFRLAPIRESEAFEMLGEISASDLLDDFRGEKAADRQAIVRTLCALSEIGVEYPDIAEIDINPLIVKADGSVCAVDALMVLRDERAEEKHPPPVDPVALGRCFYPRSVAFVGATSKIGKWGHILPTLAISRGFKGDIYFVNPGADVIAGRKSYASVTEIPGRVDLAVVTIPASGVPNLIPQLEEKNVRSMLVISSGFGETGEEGRKLEKKMTDMARKAGILVLGPNTMGISNPYIDFFCTGIHVSPGPGSTAAVSQSGNIGGQLLGFAEKQGIGIRGFSGSGNEAMVTVEDYLEAFEIDEKTRTVMLYVESIKNGRRFFEASRRISRKKPIILLKGGRTREGNRAAAGHTGSMSTNAAVFDAVCRQSGIVRAENPMDLLDLSAAFSSLPIPGGNRAAIMTFGGGWGVVATDLCAEHGLRVPILPEKVVRRIDRVLPPYWNRSNPVDIVGQYDDEIPGVIMEELLKWDGCDAVINLGIMGKKIMLNRIADSIGEADPDYSPEFLDSVREQVDAFEKRYAKLTVRLMEKYGKPVFGVSIFTDDEKTVYRVEGSTLKGIFYTTPERAVKAFAGMYGYRKFLERKHK